MPCPRCQHENRPQATFCEACGTPLSANPTGPPGPSYAEITSALSEALERETATGEILRVISSSPTDVQPVFEAIVRSAVRLCEANSGGVFRFDGALIHLVAQRGWDPVLDAVQRVWPRPPDRGTATGRAILTRAVVHVDIATDPEYAHTEFFQAHARTFLSVPMLRDGDPIGTIAVTRGEGEARPYSATQIALLETFAAQAVIAIENVRSFNETKEALEGELARERFRLLFFPAVQAREVLARALAECGEFDEESAPAHDALQMAEELDHHPFSLTWAYLSLGYVHSVRGELSQATRWLERAAAQCRDADIALLYPNAMAWLGHAYATSGRAEEGVSLLKQAVTAQTSGRTGYLSVLSIVQLGEAHLRANRIEDAGASVDHALQLARERGQRGHEAWALRLLGEIASHPDHRDAAAAYAHYGAALALASELGMRPLVAHCHLGLGKLYRQTGDGAKAEQHLGTATTMYREMGMNFWLEKAEAELTGAES